MKGSLGSVQKAVIGHGGELEMRYGDISDYDTVKVHLPQRVTVISAPLESIPWSVALMGARRTINGPRLCHCM
jgi:hypothetical protein